MKRSLRRRRKGRIGIFFCLSREKIGTTVSATACVSPLSSARAPGLHAVCKHNIVCTSVEKARGPKTQTTDLFLSVAGISLVRITCDLNLEVEGSAQD